ncbi:hypothetical protein [Pseudohalioglobus lutimaris]|uniref:Uncharacterized protein n=1 Tax=Pseudohalioglobus lutimaris TaxID=1737061 RepID=A0A2N5X7Z7_9GAMM|nr:hypothetical protein [Pseudohalioglobus lutimaris]PLW70613.1 hypothetical protein C0039_00315 [Pseudohalioglobus lutimaris]
MLSIYWFKTQAGINLFHDTSFSKYLPFRLFKLEYSIRQNTDSDGLKEDFESSLPIPNRWISVHTPIPQNIIRNYGRSCPGDSRCLIVKNKGDEWWHITHRYRFDVRENERFSLGGLLWRSSADGFAQIQITAYDKQGHIIARDKWYIETNLDEKFQRVEEEFSISPGVSTIRLRIAGQGQGEFRFDNIRLRRLSCASASKSCTALLKPQSKVPGNDNAEIERTH